MPAPAAGRTVSLMPNRARRTFFVESYVPQLDSAAAAALSSRLQAAVDQLPSEGLPLTWIRSCVLVDEETYVWMVEADEVEQVLRVQRLAGLERGHVVEARQPAGSGKQSL